MAKRTCSSCGGSLVIGTLVAKDSYTNLAAAEWLEGLPEKSIWTGLKTGGRALLPVAANRCGKCGRLEFFAEAEQKG